MNRFFLVFTLIVAVTAVGYEGWRLSQAHQALTRFRDGEVAKIQTLILNPSTGIRDDASSMVEEVLVDREITLQEYKSITKAMVQRYSRIDSSLADVFLDAGYQTSEILDQQRRTLESRTRFFAWCRTSQ